MKTKCYSVKLDNFYPISKKCFLAVDYSGNESLIPKSQFFGVDGDICGNAYWISEWILSKKNLSYSRKRAAWHDKKTGLVSPHFEVITHKPKEIKKPKPDQRNLFK
jgi:hypothetical protein